MNITSLVAQLPVAEIVGLIAAYLIPYLSALLTKHPGWWTGNLTIGLAAADGFLSQWAAAGDGFDWRKAVGASLAAWVVAVITHSKVLAGTKLENDLHAVGTTPAR